MYMDMFLPALTAVVKFIFSEIWILIHHIVEISNFPSFRCLIVDRQNIHQICRSHISFKSNNILHRLGILTSKQSCGKVLVLNVKLHRRLNHRSHCHQIWLVVAVQEVEYAPVVVLRRSVVSRRGA